MSLDVLISGGRIVDGGGGPWFHADVGLSGDRIHTIASPGSIDRHSVAEVVDASGMVVSPGFIDIQSHSIATFMTDGRSLSKVTQGVTTEIMGELWSPVPFGGRRRTRFGWTELAPEVAEIAAEWTRFHHWLEFLERRGVSVNVGSFVGGGAIREYAMGWDAGEPDAEQMETMLRVTAQAMDDGALGIATALIYPPNCYSTPRELTTIAAEVGRRGGIYVSHIRSEGDEILDALEEILDLGKATGVPLEIYHLKVTGQTNWPKMATVIDRIEAARSAGIDVTADMYPYVGSGTGLTVLLPDWVAEGGKLWERLAAPALRERILSEMRGENLPAGSFRRQPTREYVMPVGFLQPENRRYIGSNLEEIAAERRQHWSEAAVELLLSERQRIGTIYFVMSEENLRQQLRLPWIKISTDAAGLDPQGQHTPVHPRAYGTYPRVLGHYVRDEKVLRLEDAVKAMSGAVADRLGLRDRGHLRQGLFADVVVFDPEQVRDHATFSQPHQLSTGVRDVWVNGRRVLRDGCHTGATPGRAVRGTGSGR